MEEKQKFYAMKYKDDHIRMNSTSGGMFTALANYVFNLNGKVYGTAFDENFNAKVIGINTIQELELLRGVKYVKSDLGNTYENIYEDLKRKKIVLFVGTPCQCKGLKNFLSYKNISFKNLYICDLICHGTPDERVWKQYIEFINKKYKSEVDKYIFRYKGVGWRENNIFIRLKDGRKIINSFVIRSYANLFSKNLIITKGCFNCQFKNLKRVGDITIGDCWGIENINKNFDDNKGVSLVIVNSTKGHQLFSKIKNNINFIEVEKEKCLQKNLVEITELPKEYEQFWKDFNKKGYKYIAKKYSYYGIKNRIMIKLKEIIKFIIKK